MGSKSKFSSPPTFVEEIFSAVTVTSLRILPSGSAIFFEAKENGTKRKPQGEFRSSPWNPLRNDTKGLSPFGNPKGTISVSHYDSGCGKR